MALGWRVAGILMGSKGRPARKAENLAAIFEPIVQQMWDSLRLRTLQTATVCYRDSFTFFDLNIYYITSNCAGQLLTAASMGLSVDRACFRDTNSVWEIICRRI
jgi:hypothetical protein